MFGSISYGLDEYTGPIKAVIGFKGTKDKVTTQVYEGTPGEVAAYVSQTPAVTYLSAGVFETIKGALKVENWIKVSIGSGEFVYISKVFKDDADKISEAIIRQNRYKRLFWSAVGATVSSASIITGMIITDSEISLRSLATLPLAWAISFTVWYKRDVYAVLFNYESWTPSKFKESYRLSKEYLATGVRPENLKNASAVEQLAKIYALELAFMGMTGIDIDMKALAFFISTSIAYTMTTTYDLIVLKKRDEKIAESPWQSDKIKFVSNIVSSAIGFVDNVLMVAAKNGELWAIVAIWVEAAALNGYHFVVDNIIDQQKKPFNEFIKQRNHEMLPMCRELF